MPHYILRDIPDHLWRQVKAKAAIEGKSIRAVLLELIGQYVMLRNERGTK